MSQSNPQPPDNTDSEISEVVRRWFGEPVLAVEDELKALITAAANEARREEIETLLVAHDAHCPGRPECQDGCIYSRCLLDRLEQLSPATQTNQEADK